jgi:hypothetical protein
MNQVPENYILVSDQIEQVQDKKNNNGTAKKYY